MDGGTLYVRIGSLFLTPFYLSLVLPFTLPPEMVVALLGFFLPVVLANLALLFGIVTLPITFLLNPKGAHKVIMGTFVDQFLLVYAPLYFLVGLPIYYLLLLFLGYPAAGLSWLLQRPFLWLGRGLRAAYRRYRGRQGNGQGKIPSEEEIPHGD